MRRHDAESNDFATLESSRFTIPVSVIVAAYDEEVVIESTVRSLLAFDYPEFEVVVVNDGSSDGTLERLREAFDLVPYEMFVRHIFADAARSRRLPQRAASEPRRRRQGERREGGLMERRAQRRALPVRLRRRRGHRLRPEGAPHGHARGDQRPGANRRGDEPDYDRARPGAGPVHTGRLNDVSTAACSGSISISTSSERSSRTASRGRGSASCCARRAGSRSGAVTSSRRSAATRRPSRARTSSSPFASTSDSGARVATTRSAASRTASE